MHITFEKITETKARVKSIHYVGTHEGVEVASIPEPAPGENQEAELFINPQTNELWYEYVESLSNDPLVLRQMVIDLQNKIKELEANQTV